MIHTNRERLIGDRPVGPNHPVYVTAEIGLNHNGDVATCLALIDVALEAGATSVLKAYSGQVDELK